MTFDFPDAPVLNMKFDETDYDGHGNSLGATPLCHMTPLKQMGRENPFYKFMALFIDVFFVILCKQLINTAYENIL